MWVNHRYKTGLAALSSLYDPNNGSLNTVPVYCLTCRELACQDKVSNRDSVCLRSAAHSNTF